MFFVHARLLFAQPAEQLVAFLFAYAGRGEGAEVIMTDEEDLWVIGQNVLVKTAVSVEISMAAAVISCF